MLGSAPNVGGSWKGHLLDSVELVEPGSVVAGGQAALALQALVTVHQPGLQLLALRAEAHLQGSSVPASTPMPRQAHPTIGLHSVPPQLQTYLLKSVTLPLQGQPALQSAHISNMTMTTEQPERPELLPALCISSQFLLSSEYHSGLRCCSGGACCCGCC